VAQNSWIIEQLERNDVLVCDLFGKIKDGTLVGDNLGTAVAKRTHAGAVIDGGVRDLPVWSRSMMSTSMCGASTQLPSPM
jgi:regulator of RNase E activity RraA